jgi:hypothetical protein
MFDGDGNSHAFLWKDYAMVDLNDLIAKDSPWMLQSAAGINSSGQIAGQGLINGEVHGFLATPWPDTRFVRSGLPKPDLPDDG